MMKIKILLGLILVSMLFLTGCSSDTWQDNLCKLEFGDNYYEYMTHPDESIVECTTGVPYTHRYIVFDGKGKIVYLEKDGVLEVITLDGKEYIRKR